MTIYFLLFFTITYKKYANKEKQKQNKNKMF